MYTYFIRQVGTPFIKIGRATDPFKRLDGLRGCNPNKLELIGILEKDCERHLHELFVAHRIHREWFREEGALGDYLQQNAIVLQKGISNIASWKERRKLLVREQRKGKPRPRFNHPNQPPTRAQLVRAGFLKRIKRPGEIRGVAQC